MQWSKKERGDFQLEDPRKQLRPHEAAITTDEPSHEETSRGAPNALPEATSTLKGGGRHTTPTPPIPRGTVQGARRKVL